MIVILARSNAEEFEKQSGITVTDLPWKGEN